MRSSGLLTGGSGTSNETSDAVVSSALRVTISRIRSGPVILTSLVTYVFNVCGSLLLVGMFHDIQNGIQLDG